MQEKTKRNLEIYSLYFNEGWTYKKIGDRYGLTKQRVANIIRKIINRKKWEKKT